MPSPGKERLGWWRGRHFVEVDGQLFCSVREKMCYWPEVPTLGWALVWLTIVLPGTEGVERQQSLCRAHESKHKLAQNNNNPRYAQKC